MEIKFLECILENFLYQYILEQTRPWGYDTTSLLDLIFLQSNIEMENVKYETLVGRCIHVALVVEEDLRGGSVKVENPAWRHY